MNTTTIAATLILLAATTLASTTTAATDLDADGLQDVEELRLGTDPSNPDSDGDTLHDGAEVHSHGTDPLAVDTDMDGLWDDAELQWGTNPLHDDTDHDGIPDNRDQCPTQGARCDEPRDPPLRERSPAEARHRIQVSPNATVGPLRVSGDPVTVWWT